MMPLTTFAEANEYLTRYYRNQRVEYNLDNMRALVAHLGDPQEKFRTVHIAGTSGKTSTAYYMSALLTAGGYKTGLTVSPHVDEINERVQVNNQPLGETEFCAALTEYLTIIDKSTVQPSWFELIVAFAYWYFAREQVEIVVVEVGLGGFKDGTNVITRPDKTCIITDIGLDHVNVLGKSLAEIAAQKSGIIQAGNRVFTYDQGPEVMNVIKEACQQKGAKLEIIMGDYDQNSQIAAYQMRNWYLAYKTYQHVDIGGSHLTHQVLEATQRVQVPGRMDILQVNDKQIIMDGAHNTQKMSAFLDSFKQLYPGAQPAVLIALSQGKEYESIAPLIAAVASRVIVTAFESQQDLPLNSIEPEVLSEALKAAGATGVEVISDLGEATRALLAGNEKTGIITGSFYLLNQIRSAGYLKPTP